MELIGEQLIRAPRNKVWDALNDPAILSRCIPGCEEVSKISESETRARVVIKIGPVRARFAGNIFMSDIEPPTKCTLVFEGSGGAAGFAKGRSVVTLTEEGGATRLTYSVEAAIGGKLGQIGGRLIDSSAKKMADEFFTAFDAALRSPAQPDVATQRNTRSPVMAGTTEAAAVSIPVAPADRMDIAKQGHLRGGGFQSELYRAFWFSMGVAFTLLMTRWVS